MKRWMALTMLVLLLVGLLPAAASGAEPEPLHVVVDGIELHADVPPMLIDNRTMVPFRAIAEALGVQVEWQGESRTILATSQGTILKLVVGEKAAWINGAAKGFDVAPLIVNNRTLVPVRLFAEAFGARVKWDAATRTAGIWSAVRPMRTLAFYGLGSYEHRGYISRFSDVAFTWASVTPDGQLSLNQNEYFWPEGAEEVLQLARDGRTDRFLTVVAVDGDDRLTKLVLNPEARERLAAQIEQVVLEHKLEGVVLDLEGLGWRLAESDLAQVRQGYVALVKEVSDRLHRNQKEVIAAVMPPNGWYPGYDYKAIAQQADRVLVMAYPYTPAGSTDPEPLDKVEEAILLSLQEMAPKKVLLGIMVEHENAVTVAQKVSLAKRHNLSGIAIWILKSLDPAEMDAIDSLVAPLR
jgi:hypothetical protein